MSPADAERLALQAALLPRSEAVSAWHRLLAGVEWMDLPDPAVRCLPSIAVNLGCHSRPGAADSRDVPHAARLAGVYRATWTANIMRIRGLSPVLASLSAHEVRFRVLKGAAICALTDHWGVRRMGDIDLVVHEDDASATARLLRRMHVTPRFSRVVDDSAMPRASCWVGPQGQILDLHVGNPSRRGVNVLDVVLDGPGITAESQGRTWRLPTLEAMVVHAAAHAGVGASVTDHAQAVLDLSRLLPRTDPRALEELAQRTRVVWELDVLQGALADLTGQARAPRRSRTATTLSAIGRTVDHVRDEARRLPQVLAERTAGEDGRDVTFTTTGRARTRLYRMWQATGQLRPLERAICRVLGGFVVTGSIDLPRDRRLRVHVPPILHGRSATITLTCPDDYARLLFIDGRSHGVIDGDATVRLTAAPRSVEVSMRLLGSPPHADMSPLDVRISPSSDPEVGHAWT